MRRSLFILALLVALISIKASATTVTGTVTDPDSTVWANGSITFNLIGNSGSGYSCAGVKMTASQTTVTSTLDGSGAFSVTLCPNSTITPVSTQWAIQVSSAATAPPQILTPTTVAGSSQSLTTYINGLLTAIRISAVFGTRAYTDTEISNAVAGITYFNITSGTMKFYNGSAWASQASGSSIANATTTVGTTVVNANACNLATPVTMTGVTTGSTFAFTPTTDIKAVTGWGTLGGLKIIPFPTANTLNYEVCNQTSSNITPSGSVVFNVSAK